MSYREYISVIFVENNRQPSAKTNSLDQALENVLSVGQKSTNTPNVKTSSLLPSLSLSQNGIATNIIYVFCHNVGQYIMDTCVITFMNECNVHDIIPMIFIGYLYFRITGPTMCKYWQH